MDSKNEGTSEFSRKVGARGDISEWLLYVQVCSARQTARMIAEHPRGVRGNGGSFGSDAIVTENWRKVRENQWARPGPAALEKKPALLR